MTDRHYPIRIDAWFRPMLASIFLRPRRCYVHLDGDTVEVRMDWAFRAHFTRGDVLGAATSSTAPPAWGIHGFGGRWLVNGSREGIVVITLREGVRARVLGVPVRLAQLSVSVDAPGGLTAALASG